jgi:hypothetical protein
MIPSHAISGDEERMLSARPGMHGGRGEQERPDDNVKKSSVFVFFTGSSKMTCELMERKGADTMELREYFDMAQGRGIMSTADANGNVTAAVYARPHFFADGSVAFVMADRLTHKNLESNPHAVYLFMEAGEQYEGKRLYLTKIKEEKDSALIEQVRRRNVCPADAKYKVGTRFLVYFRVDKVLPLIGDKK